jgi:uncharacterized membrane protein
MRVVAGFEELLCLLCLVAALALVAFGLYKTTILSVLCTYGGIACISKDGEFVMEWLGWLWNGQSW